MRNLEIRSEFLDFRSDFFIINLNLIQKTFRKENPNLKILRKENPNLKTLRKENPNPTRIQLSCLYKDPKER